jgi:kynureninase
MSEQSKPAIIDKNSLEYARQLDASDPMRAFRDRFYIPVMHGKEAIYFTGNSLGLQPRSTQEYVLNELEDWATFGVEGHFHARNPWVSYHELFPPLLAPIVGAKENELIVMNQLTVNLHLLMTSFYRPEGKRFRIICEAKAFPSDQYAFQSQVKLHGFDPAEAIIEVGPRPGQHHIEHEDILDTIRKYGPEVAVVLFSGVNYYTGQVFNMKEICSAAHEAGAYCGFDLAHAAGNVELKLHDWDVDFACWCSYKYLNSGPGSVAGAFIHQRHINNTELPRLAGWWGHDKANRFKMEKEFVPIQTAEGWQLSNAPILSMAAHKSSLDIFHEAGMPNLLEKARKLSAYLFYILQDINDESSEPFIELITPKEEHAHGCQVSMLMLKDGKNIFEALRKHSIIADWREPNVIRVAPVPLYNRFEDVFHLGSIIRNMIQ